MFVVFFKMGQNNWEQKIVQKTHGMAKQEVVTDNVCTKTYGLSTHFLNNYNTICIAL
jgi:hypothetical protein